MNLKGFRTVAFNLISLVVLGATALTGQITDAKWLTGLGIVVMLGNLVLRFLTDTPVGKSA